MDVTLRVNAVKQDWHVLVLILVLMDVTLRGTTLSVNGAKIVGS